MTPHEGPDARGPARDAPAARRLIESVPIGGIHDTAAILDRFLAWVRSRALEPYPAQEEALLELMTGRHVILSTPTGSGKSLVALGLHFKAMCEGRRSFYTAPIKALVSEKFFDLCDQFGAGNVGMLTGDASINWAAPIVCCTAEVLANMAVSQGERTDAPYVVMDEFHYYGDRDRGAAWQIPLIALPRTRFLLMSATLGDTRSIEQHIRERTGVEVSRIHSEERPVPLDFRYVETPIHETVEKLLRSREAPVYIVHFTQRDATEQAQALTSTPVVDKERRQAIAEAIGGFRFDTPFGRDMRRLLGHGIGLHHAGLLPKYRLLVERLAQQGLLAVICGTDTLGVGVNVPIRTVLFTKLSKFDGQKVSVLQVRDFKQIAGRAGRKGFDDHGTVVVQAPQHVIENKRAEARARGASTRRKKTAKVKKRPPPPGFVSWGRETFDRLVHSPPETLRSRFTVTHALIVACLRSEAGSHGAGTGYRVLASLIDHCHDAPPRKRRLRRRAARLFRSLRHAGVVEVVPDEHTGRPTVQVSPELQRDFSLHQSLSLYLVDAAAALDRESPDYALDLLSVTEAILDDPRPILFAQERKARGELIAKLKAERVPYEERMARVQNVSWPKPGEEFIHATFALFAEHHPWVGGDAIRPKGVAREIFETYSEFNDYVKRMEIARVEGLLLRYLGEVHDTLARSIPAAQKTEEVYDMAAFFRAMIARVDSSLLQAWEEMVRPAAAAAPEAPPREYDLALDARGLRARIRSELSTVVRALAARRYDEIPEWLHPESREEWTPARIEAALTPFYERYDAILYDPRARRGHLCVIDPLEPRRWRVRQVLVDDEDDRFWAIEGEVDLREERNPGDPLLRLRRIGE
jgi:superfamily II RNA helicase